MWYPSEFILICIGRGFQGLFAVTDRYYSMLSFSPSILITFEFLTLPTAAIIVGIAGSDFIVRERGRETFKTCSSLPHSLPPTSYTSLISFRNVRVEEAYY